MTRLTLAAALAIVALFAVLMAHDLAIAIRYGGPRPPHVRSYVTAIPKQPLGHSCWQCTGPQLRKMR